MDFLWILWQFLRDYGILSVRDGHVNATIAHESKMLRLLVAERRLAVKFESMLQVDVPKGREGKHKEIIELLLSDMSQLQKGAALKILLSALPDTKENIRAALSRATKQRKINIATSSDTKFLYVWLPDERLV